MCVGALVHARIATLVFGAAEPKSGRRRLDGARAAELAGLNHRFEVVAGVREEACRALIQEFFRKRAVARIIYGPLHSRVSLNGEVPKWS